MQVFEVSGFAFSRDSDDTANATGSFAAIPDVLRSGEKASAVLTPGVD